MTHKLCPKKYYGGVCINNNECIFIKFRIDDSLNLAFKNILEKEKTTQQEVLENLVKNYVLKNLKLLVSKESK